MANLVAYLIIYITSMAASYASPSGTRRPRNDICHFGSTQYVIGDTWHPHLRPYGTDYCILCSCHEAHQIRCESTNCPRPTCAYPVRIPGRCCPTCSFDEYGITMTTPEPSTTPQKCAYKGREYLHGEFFSTTDIFRKRREDQCVQCSCSEGRVYCALRTCPVIPCASSVVLPDSCCPVCETTAGTESDYADEDLTGGNDLHGSLDLTANEHAVEGSFPDNTAGVNPGNDPDDMDVSELDPSSLVCESNDETYYEGQSWHPVLAPFGRMDCISCTCQRGEAVCGRMTCPDEDQLPCANPIQQRGDCCKICPDMHPHSTDSSDDSPYEDEDSPSDATSLETAASMCLRKSETILLHEFISPSSNQTVDGLEMLRAPGRNTSRHRFALEDLETGLYEIHSWEFIDGVLQDFRIEELTELEFQHNQDSNSSDWLQLVGATTRHRLQKLKRKERKLERNCTESNCQRQAVRIARVLRPRPVESSSECTQQPPSDTTPRQRVTAVGPTQG